jgi:hypothetical protein
MVFGVRLVHNPLIIEHIRQANAELPKEKPLHEMTFYELYAQIQWCSQGAF